MQQPASGGAPCARQRSVGVGPCARGVQQLQRQAPRGAAAAAAMHAAPCNKHTMHAPELTVRPVCALSSSSRSSSSCSGSSNGSSMLVGRSPRSSCTGRSMTTPYHHHRHFIRDSPSRLAAVPPSFSSQLLLIGPVSPPIFLSRAPVAGGTLELWLWEVMAPGPAPPGGPPGMYFLTDFFSFFCIYRMFFSRFCNLRMQWASACCHASLDESYICAWGGWRVVGDSAPLTVSVSHAASHRCTACHASLHTVTELQTYCNEPVAFHLLLAPRHPA